MSMRLSTLATGVLLGAMLVAGSFMTAHAGDGCTKDKNKDSGTATAFPTQIRQL